MATEHLSFDSRIAYERAETGMRLALDHARQDLPTWPDIAYAFLKRYAEKEPQFTGFMVTMAAKQSIEVPNPPTDKAWGAIYRKAMRDGVIEKTDKFMPHPKRHACPAIVYRSCINKAA